MRWLHFNNDGHKRRETTETETKTQTHERSQHEREDVQRRQREIAARLSLLEFEARVRSRLHDDD